MSEKREAGSIPGFVVVAVILIGLLIGGAYFVQKQQSARSPQPISEHPKDEQKPAQEGPSSTPPPSSSSTPQQSSSNSAPVNEAQQQLPQSGLTDVFIPTLLVGTLVGISLYYMQSRRRLAASL